MNTTQIIKQDEEYWVDVINKWQMESENPYPPIRPLAKQISQAITQAVEEERERMEDKYETAIDFLKSFEKRAWDAWKPVQVFRNDSQVEADEVRKELLDDLQDEAQEILDKLTK